MSEKTMVMQSFFPRFLLRKRLKIHKYCGSISFLSSPLWLKTSQIFRHMANIFAFGDVASGQRQRWAWIDGGCGTKICIRFTHLHSKNKINYGGMPRPRAPPSHVLKRST